MTHSMPEDFAAKLKEARAKKTMVGERRVVTILFSDVMGSTEMAEQLDPEDWADIMDGAFEYLIAPIYRYEGTVARLMGDAILAFFGAPVAHEDDPQRAVLAGLEIQEGIQPYCDQIQEQYGLKFSVRVGINTGTVVVGPIGSDLAMEYTAMGDAVNLASRMEQTADPGTVQLAENTYKLVAPLFDVEPLGAIEVKGKREALPAYRVVGRKTEPGRTRGIEGLSSPLIGREDEFEKLKSVLEDFKNGRGGIVTIIGEAGLGKSRLIEELKAEFEADLDPETPDLWSELRGIAYDASLPYGLFVQQLRQTYGVTLDDSPETVHEKMTALIGDAPSEMGQRFIRVIGVLLTLARQSQETDNGSPLEGEALKRELFQAMFDLWSGEITAIGSSIAVLDDLQWADDASVELLLHLFQLTEEMPILIICAMRPYRDSPAWRIKAVAERDYPHRYTEIVLRPFASGEEQNLARNLLDLPDLPKEMGDLIVRKSEGNPFFVEELVRTFIDQGVVTREENGQAWRVAQEVGTIPIPDNLQAVIVARMDRLEKEVQRTLQLASVIGRSFYHRVLQRISELEAELDRHLNTLQRVEIIREAARVPELEFMFRHELTRDAAYQSILKKRRREFHEKVGQALEELFPERQEELAPVLAHHFSEGGDLERALKYYTVAGDTAVRLFANAEAISHYSKAIELAKRDSVTGDQMVHLFTSRGRAMELGAAYEDALAYYDVLEAIASEREDRSMELASLLARTTLRVTINPAFDPEKGQALCDKA
ncbi:MAG: AAA family ATPase, partial [Chloroflexi bacterium]|nr:AAA family ATPase [Chloroflexota bacterium]